MGSASIVPQMPVCLVLFPFFHFCRPSSYCSFLSCDPFVCLFILCSLSLFSPLISFFLFLLSLVVRSRGCRVKVTLEHIKTSEIQKKECNPTTNSYHAFLPLSIGSQVLFKKMSPSLTPPLTMTQNKIFTFLWFLPVS